MAIFKFQYITWRGSLEVGFLIFETSRNKETKGSLAACGHPCLLLRFGSLRRLELSS